jgi:hypothetical protein
MSPFHNKKKKADTPADNQLASSASALGSSRSDYHGFPGSFSQSGYGDSDHDMMNTPFTPSASGSK